MGLQQTCNGGFTQFLSLLSIWSHLFLLRGGSSCSWEIPAFFLKPTALNFPPYSCLPRKSPPRGFAIASNDSLLTRRGWCGSCYRAKRRQKASGDYLGQNSGFCIPRHSPLQSSAAPTGLTTLKYVRGPWFSFHYVAMQLSGINFCQVKRDQASLIKKT